MPYGQGSYGGRQQGQARIVVDENGNQQVVYDDVDVSSQAGHEYSPGRGFIAPKRTNIGTFVSLGALGAGAANSALAPGAITSSGAGGVPAGVSGYSSAAVWPGLQGTGLTAYGGSQAAGLGLLGSAPAIGGAAATPAAFTPSLVNTPTTLTGTQAMTGYNPAYNAAMDWQGPMQAGARGGSNFGGAGGWGRQMAGNYMNQLGQAAPSLLMSAFMGGDARALQRAQAQEARARTVSQDQANQYREWMRPIMQQAMLGMIRRMPTELQGNLPQNFPQWQGSIAPAPRAGQPQGAPPQYLPRF